MKILIVEDEIHIARYLSKMVKDILNLTDSDVDICVSRKDAISHISQNKIDLLLLDLNLRGKDGFEILKSVLSEPFRVIVVSAHSEKAIEAFEYGVLDFVPKPFTKVRMQTALNRMKGRATAPQIAIKYFMVKKRHRLLRILEKDVLYFEAYGHYSKMHLKDGRVELYDKALITLEPLLDKSYARVHKSYIVKMPAFKSISVYPGGKYELTMINEDTIPVGRTHYKSLKGIWFSR